MDITNLNIELNVKIKEAFKSVLKRKNVEILHGIEDKNNNITSKSIITYNKHKFILISQFSNEGFINLNQKYVKLIPKKIKLKLKNLDNSSRIRLFDNKLWYLKILRPFKGKLYESITDKSFIYTLNYNSIIINLSKKDFDRLNFYVQYIYKLQQLQKLNNELDIEQEFTIVFDDEKSNFLLLNKINKIFGNLME